MELIAKVKTAFKDLDADEQIKAEALDNLEEWLRDARLECYRPYIEHLINRTDFIAVLDSFWRMMPFGTGGRRGPVGAGPNRINPYTIALSVQGHCEYLRKATGGEGEMKVVVAYDVRQFHDLRGVYRGVDGVLSGLTSLDMARESAMTYAANRVAAYVIGPLEDEPGAPACTDRFISTPELSFLIRELGCAGGLNISASHNHPDDNGGKFYNGDGGQEIPPHDEALLKVVEQVKRVETLPYAEARENGLIRFVPDELHRQYIELNTALSPSASRSAKVAFTPLCGTGTTTVQEALEELGFDVFPVPEQSVCDGSFAPVRYRIGNPEVPDSMDKLEQVARDTGCEIGFSTDPDADRLGMIVKNAGGEYVFVNGNEVGILLLESILQAKRRDGTLPKNPIFINTLVTSSLQREIARRYGCQVIGDLMVGFKYMGAVLGDLERAGRFPAEEGPETAGRDSAVGTLDDFIFTTEESHGYLLTPRIRDKDACGAAVHLAGLTCRLKDENKTLLDMLRDIYRVYGYYRNELRSLVMEGITGLERIGRIQERLRENPPREIAGMIVVNFVDNHKVGGPLKSSTDAASRNVLLFELDSGEGRIIRLIVRPSGTEPKTKIYVEVPSKSPLEGTLFDIEPDELKSIDDSDFDRLVAETNAKATEVGNAFIRYCLGPQVLGDVYPEIPEESLLVSDLVPVEHKIRFGEEILPELGRRMARSEGDVNAWLDDQLGPFGEDPRGLVRKAALTWAQRVTREGILDNRQLETVRELFRLKD